MSALLAIVLIAVEVVALFAIILFILSFRKVSRDVAERRESGDRLRRIVLDVSDQVTDHEFRLRRLEDRP